MSERTKKLGLFNPDILELVLSKLQTRDLLRMKCVSRSWRDLIRDRSFALRHSRQRPPLLSGFLFQKNLGWTGLDVSDVSYILAERKEEELPRLLNNIVDSIPADLMMVSSCNGLICGTRCSFQNDTLPIRVGNPLTREGFHFDWKRCGGRVLAVGLAFNPCRDLTNNSTNFKVVLVQEEAGSDGNVWLAFHVYSSETGTWRLSDVNVRCGFPWVKVDDDNCVSIKGVLYWPTCSGILAFDVENELAYMVSPPRPSSEPGQGLGASAACMGESDGKLHYVMVQNVKLQIWVLEDLQEDGKWSLEFDKFFADMENDLVGSLCLQLVETRYNTLWGSPLGFKDGFLLLNVSGAIYLLNTRDGGFRRIADVAGFCTKDEPLSGVVLPYSMSLVPLNPP